MECCFHELVAIRGIEASDGTGFGESDCENGSDDQGDNDPSDTQIHQNPTVQFRRIVLDQQTDNEVDWDKTAVDGAKSNESCTGRRGSGKSAVWCSQIKQTEVLRSILQSVDGSQSQDKRCQQNK